MYKWMDQILSHLLNDFWSKVYPENLPQQHIVHIYMHSAAACMLGSPCEIIDFIWSAMVSTSISEIQWQLDDGIIEI